MTRMCLKAESAAHPAVWLADRRPAGAAGGDNRRTRGEEMPAFRFEPALPNAQAPDTHYNGTAETCQPGPAPRTTRAAKMVEIV